MAAMSFTEEGRARDRSQEGKEGVVGCEGDLKRLLLGERTGGDIIKNQKPRNCKELSQLRRQRCKATC